MLKIYGADLSAPANKVRMAANAMEISPATADRPPAAPPSPPR